MRVWMFITTNSNLQSKTQKKMICNPRIASCNRRIETWLLLETMHVVLMLRRTSSSDCGEKSNSVFKPSTSNVTTVMQEVDAGRG